MPKIKCNPKLKDETICPFCQVMIDTEDAYEGYRKEEAYKNKEYPEWCFPEGKDLTAHLINFHRLPSVVSQKMAIVVSFMKIKEKLPPNITINLPVGFFTGDNLPVEFFIGDR